MLPNRAEALRNADQLAGQGNINAAIAVYRGLVETDPLDLNSIHALGDLYVRAGRIQDALNEMAKLADRFLASGPPINAAPLLKKMLDLDPSNALVRMKLGVVYARAGKAEEAHQAFIEAGAVLARKGNIAAAIDANRRALAVNPESQQARAAIAVLERHAAPRPAERPDAQSAPAKLRGTAELAELGEMLSAASAEVPDSEVTDEFVVGQLVAAELLVGCGDIDKAVSVLKRILVSRPDAVDVRTKLKDIYLRSGMMKEAAGEFMEIARIYDGRGDGERAQDFTVRARRIIQHLSQIGATTGLESHHIGEAAGTGSEPAVTQATAEPIRANVSPAIDLPAVPPQTPPTPTAAPAMESHAAAPVAQPLADARRSAPEVAALPTAVIAEPPARAAVPVASVAEAARLAPQPPVAMAPQPPVKMATAEAVADHAREPESVEVAATAVPASANAYATAALDPVVLPVSEAGRTTLGLLDEETETYTEGGPHRSRLFRFAVAAAIGIVLGGSGYAGLRVYEARIERQYRALEEANNIPSSAVAADSGQANLPPADEHMEVRADSAPPVAETATREVTEPATQPREERTRPEDTRQERTAAQPPVSAPPTTANTNTTPQPSRAAAPSPPVVSAPNAIIGGDTSQNAMPAGMTRAAGGAEPPPPPVEVARKASVVVKGESVRQVQPDYPSVARSARQAGVVSVEVSINERGEVVSARALGGPTLLREPAVSAARRWKFKPAMRDGKPVACASVITFNFKL